MALIPAGKYRAKAQTYELAQTKNGDPQVAIDFSLKLGDGTYTRHPWFGHFTEKTTDRTLESLRHMGYQGTNLLEVTPAMLPNVIEVVVEHETDQKGQPRSKIRWVNRGAGSATPLATDKRANFAAEMAKRFKAVDAETARRLGDARGPSQAPTLPGTERDEDEEIPF